jgi:hypothetical protein
MIKPCLLIAGMAGPLIVCGEATVHQVKYKCIPFLPCLFPVQISKVENVTGSGMSFVKSRKHGDA